MLFSVGLHLAVERILVNLELRTILFLDDALLKAKSPLALNTFLALREELATIGLKIHMRKCEIYTLHPTAQLRDSGILGITDSDQWSYLGSPLCEQSDRAYASAVSRVKHATQTIARLGAAFPRPLRAGTSRPTRTTRRHSDITLAR